LIIQVFERESELFSLRHARHAEVKPSFVIVALHVRGRVARNPQVERVLLEAALRSTHIPAAELAAEYDLRVRDFPSCSLRECLD
jgi:hypothetical protein